MKQYKVAIIGNGMICNAAHIPAYKAMGDKVKIVAVADIREEAAKETAERHGIPKIGRASCRERVSSPV